MDYALLEKLTICIPAYNEATNIRATLTELKSAFPDSEIIVVNDGSTDHTQKEAESVEGITVITHEGNRGYGASLKTAMRRAQGEVFAWYDSDGQHKPDDLLKVVEPVLTHRADAVIGVRQAGSDVRLDRLPGKLLLKLVAEMIARQPIPDLNSGMRCFRKGVISRYYHLLPDGFSASTTSTLLMIKRGYRVETVGIVTQKRVGKSTVRIFKDGWATLTLMIRILILFEAFGFFTLLGLIQILCGLSYGFYLALVNKLGFPVLGATITISGVLTFFMGLVCDQITALRKERFED